MLQGREVRESWFIVSYDYLLHGLGRDITSLAEMDSAPKLRGTSRVLEMLHDGGVKRGYDYPKK